MLPRKLGRSTAERAGLNSETLTVAIAAALVGFLFVTMTVGSGWLGATGCAAPCR